MVAVSILGASFGQREDCGLFFSRDVTGCLCLQSQDKERPEAMDRRRLDKTSSSGWSWTMSLHEWIYCAGHTQNIAAKATFYTYDSMMERWSSCG